MYDEQRHDQNLPGVRLRSGFENGRVVPAGLSGEAAARVQEKSASVDEARARALESSLTAWVG